MDKQITEKGKEFANFLLGLSDEEKAEMRKQQIEESNAEYSEFKNFFDDDKCYICKKSLKTFSSGLPCLHWLLRPKGFKKKHFLSVVEKYGFFETQTYLRWVATQEAKLSNINDMALEGTGKKFEVTIRYKHLEWSFSCSDSDYYGHKSAMNGSSPHYHFQMRVDSQPFIRFNDFHIPFSERELIHIEAMTSSDGKIVPKFLNGYGMADVFNDEMLEKVLRDARPVDNEKDGVFHTSTFIMAEEGKEISGDDIDALIQEAREKNVTFSSLSHRLPNAARRVMVTPGEAVVEQASRKGGRGKNNK